MCTNGWTPLNAAVVCNQLGYGGGITATSNNSGPGEGMVWMENVNCNGSESRLTDCPFGGWGVTSCNHFQDVGVICNSKYLQSFAVT